MPLNEKNRLQSEGILPVFQYDKLQARDANFCNLLPFETNRNEIWFRF